MKFKTFKKCTKNIQKRKALLALRAFLEKFRIEVVYSILIVLLSLKLSLLASNSDPTLEDIMFD